MIPLPEPTAILAIVDPGVWRCGLAVFRAGRLIFAGEPNTRETPCHSMAELVARTAMRETRTSMVGYPFVPWVWVAEIPQDYEAKSAREGTLDELRQVITEIEIWRPDAGIGKKTHTVRPHGWKGNVPKPVHHRRIVAALDARERDIIEALPRTRDALDAVGLGLFVLRRVGRGGVKPA